MPHSFACFTENPQDLDPAIKVIPLENEWSGWWSKVNIFNGESYRDIFENVCKGDELADQKRLLVFYIDLDMILTGPIDDLFLNF